VKREDTKTPIEEVLSDVFERVQEIHTKKSEEEALYFALDLALAKVPAESGTVFRADAGSGDLRFSAVRGPKAPELLKAKMVVPAGTGIVGFCAIEGVSLAVSDVQKDPRHYSKVTERLNYVPTSAICAPMMTDGRTFGCMQLLNRTSGPVFKEEELGILSYIAHQVAMYLSARA
jgi:GAF domain-containing protein